MTGILLYSCLFLGVFAQSVDNSDQSEPVKHILVFGGNAFMGAATVKVLLNEDNYNIAIVNRGNWYWDSEDYIKPYVHHIVCDRYADNITSSCPQLVSYITEMVHFKAVVDFSSLSGKAMENSLELLHGKTDLYVYISSDSVYEISERNYDGASREDGFELPQDPVYLELLKQSDDYAWGKIEGELVLEKYAKKGQKYVALRLPDVIGPRDTFEDRWFRYFLWLKLSRELKKPVRIPVQFLNSQMSMVYVEDLAQQVGKILQMDPTTLDTAFNLGFKERITLLKVLQLFEAEMPLSGVDYELDETNEYYLWLPSVKKGPIDITKATKELDWKPSDIPAAIRQTVRFFEDAMRRGAREPSYRRQRARVIQKLKESVFIGQEKELDDAIDATYMPYEKKKDEL